MQFFLLGALVVGALLVWGGDLIGPDASGLVPVLLLLLLALSYFLMRMDRGRDRKD